MSGGAFGRRQVLLLVILLHFGFQLRQLFADFIICFQIGKLLIQGSLLAKVLAFRFRLHLIDTAFKRFKTRHSLIQFAAVQLTTDITGRACRLVAQRQCLLTGTGFTEFIFQLANLFLHPHQRVVNQCRFLIEGGDQIRQFLFLNQRGARQILFVFTQRQLGFLLPLRLLRGGLLNATG
ncbi:Uncharacterised protein [Citrobacter koseri]|uniref:Uncharacterized protein n=1 Tax=Citrobacter koseri TaxID=545 RepID=A0A2X2WNX9_CITKO|nr:Uncharacterised protein [Citrobacter koseri]